MKSLFKKIKSWLEEEDYRMTSRTALEARKEALEYQRRQFNKLKNIKPISSKSHQTILNMRLSDIDISSNRTIH